MASIISAGTTSGTSLNLSGDTSGVLQLASNGSTTALTIGTSQQVGIGTSSPVVGRALTLNSSSNYFGLVLQTSGTTRGQFIQESTGNIYVDAGSDGGSGALIFRTTGGIERGQFDSSGNFKFNSGYGSVAIAYGCRAWVNFNGTGTPAIRASGNVSSITDNGTGEYTVNFTTAMPDANYSIVGTTDFAAAFVVCTDSSSAAPAAGSCRVNCRNSGASLTDSAFMFVSVFR